MQLIDKPLAGSRPSAARNSFNDSVESSIRHAVESFASWRRSSSSERVDLVNRLAGRLADEATELAELIAHEVGKPVRFGRVEVRRTAEMLCAIVKRYRTAPASSSVKSARLRRRPHGVVAVITPWNNPVYISMGKIIPAVLYGNTVVWKPAPEAHAVAQRLIAELENAGWPTQVVNLLRGDRPEGEALMSDVRVSAVTLTGSPPAGERAQRICGQRRIPLQAELGGNNAAIVWPDADLALAARQVAAGAFEQAGQRCTANRRVVVHESCRQQFLQLLVRECAALSWGDPLIRGTRIGPLVSAAHRERIAAVVDRAVASCGPRILPQGEDASVVTARDAAFYPPTILCCDDPAAEIVQEETFGPVLVVQTARDWKHAMNLCNGVRQGLAASVFTRADQTVERFLDEAQAGVLKVNMATADAEVDVPFGGWKASGVGPPAHGSFDMEFFTRPQTVYRIELSKPEG